MGTETGSTSAGLDRILLPKGFSISLYADQVPGARSMALGANGTIFVGTRAAGTVYALRDNDHNFRADKVYTIARNLQVPNGVAFYRGSLYVAEIHRILRFDRIEERLSETIQPVIIYDKFPRKKRHGWKYIAFGPDNKLYVPVGAPCNRCVSGDSRFATLMRMDPDGSHLEIFAHGIRNTVGFDWHPITGELWFTENGSDWMGNNIPPDELNRAPGKGIHFGYPFCHGKNITDRKYGEKKSCKNFTPPAIELGAHVAALGMMFYTGKQFPQQYHNQIFIAEHGSWNRTPPSGYRITMVQLDDNRAISYTVFAKGWLQGTKSWGRPVDLLQLPDGSILVSDDKRGVIYRIHYTGPNRS